MEDLRLAPAFDFLLTTGFCLLAEVFDTSDKVPPLLAGLYLYPSGEKLQDSILGSIQEFYSHTTFYTDGVSWEQDVDSKNCACAPLRDSPRMTVMG